MEEVRLDPWGDSVVRDYEKLFTYFGIRPFKEVLPLLGDTHPLIRRGVVFGHRDFDKVLQAFRSEERVALLTGFMPSGRFHFGHKMLLDQIIYYQRLGVDVIIAIADIEAYVVRRIPRREAIRIGIEEYVANAVALGLDLSRARVYFQSNMDAPYYRLVQMFSQKVTMAEMEAIYGELTPGKIIASLTQMADILHPMLEEYGGYRYVFVPVGPDQDPHIRLSRDIADRFEGELGLRRPASTYHRFMTGLNGGKMSSSRPDSAIFLLEPVESAVAKLKKALTGGRATVEEQRRLGGVPEACSIYEMYVYHLSPTDEDLLSIYKRCVRGELLCGDDKREAAERLMKWMEEHRRRWERALSEVEGKIDVPSF